MGRPVRSRRAPIKLAENDNVVGIKLRNNKKITEVNADNKKSFNDATESVTSQSEKGILLAGKKTLSKIPQSPVLRDRTNLPMEIFKIDILMKKGTDDISTKKTTKSMRLTAKRTANEEIESENPTMAKRLRLGKTKDPEPAVETTENLPLRNVRNRRAVTEKDNIRKVETEKENTRKAVTEKRNNQKSVSNKENAQKVVPEKENIEIASSGKENTENVSAGKENTKNASSKKVNTENISLEKENTRKAVTEKLNTRKLVSKKRNTKKAVSKKENTQKVVHDKENTENPSPGKENIENESSEEENSENTSPEKERTQNVPVTKENEKNGTAKGKAKNLQIKTTSKKLKIIKEASASTNEDDSLVVESENAADSQNAPKVRSAKTVAKKVKFSKLSLSQRTNESSENRKKKSLRRSSELRKKEKNEATSSDAATGKKFFKSKGAGINAKKILSGKKIATNERRKVERPSVSTSFRLRQTTLSESFAKHATKKNLRPRVTQKNYHESTTLKTSASDKDETKGPVYKTKLPEVSDGDVSEIYEFHFDSNDSCEKIAKKKKKKMGKNVITKKRTKALGNKKTISKPKTAMKIAVNENKIENVQQVLPIISNEPMDTIDVPAIVINDFCMLPVPDKSEKVKTQPKRLEPQPERVESLKMKPKIVESLNLTGGIKMNLTSTPQLAKSSETNVRPLRTTNAFNVPRPSVQYRTMLNHALLNKSLSPIKKSLENFDPGSPWRPPVITGPQFSRVRNVVQSTPQIRKFSTMLESNRNSLESKNEPAIVQIDKISENDEKTNIGQTKIKASAKMDKIAENNEKANIEQTKIKASAKMDKIAENNEKANIEQTKIKASAKMDKIAENYEKSANIEQTKIKATAKMNRIAEMNENSANVEQTNIMKPMPHKSLGFVKSPRKFGTVISNVNVDIPSSNSPILINENNVKTQINRGSPSKNQTPRLAELSDTRISDGNGFDDYADKENSIPVFTSPKKSLKSPKKLVAKSSPLRHFDQAKIAMKENWEPQPGPSGLQKRSDLNESRILRQSNLNNFLNIDEVPTSTKISTTHGIFADAHSTPLPAKIVKVITTEANVENAFGFDDIGESDIDLSPITSELFADPPAAKIVNKIFEKKTKIEGKKGVIVPSRFSIGEIKKHLRPVVSDGKAKIDPVKRIEKDDNQEKREEKAENDKREDVVTFSDTFDVLTAADEANDKENAQEIPLFADLEPVHFKQPPRHSYKRKRILAFNFSEDEEENEDRESHNRIDNNATKKRKISKIEKRRQKQIEEWAKGLNNTFEEIDHFDLLVEKQ